MRALSLLIRILWYALGIVFACCATFETDVYSSHDCVIMAGVFLILAKLYERE